MAKRTSGSSGGTPTLSTDHLIKDYGDGQGVGGRDGVEVTVHSGEVVMLVGPNGAGKSTLLGCCAGLVEPTEGSLAVEGHEVGSVEARAATSVIPDDPVLYDDLSVWEHIEYVARMHHTVDWESYAEDLLDWFGLTDRADDLPSTFSRGLRQKTSLILGLIRPFRLLLVDEPFVGLDGPGQEALVEIIGDVAAEGAAVLCSTHQLDLVPVATRCLGLRDGEITFDGAPSAEQIRALVGS